MKIELEDAIYDSKLELIQVEITGCCNMHCKHCRAAEQPKKMINKNQMIKIFDFANLVKSDNFKFTFSGGEPFMNPNLYEYLLLAKEKGIDQIVITTNASLITDDILEKLNSLNLSFLCIQISIDSIYPDVHNAFRKYPNAFEKCEAVLDKIKKYENINSSIRMTITKDTINQIDKMIDFAISKKCKFLGLGSVIPFGNALDGKLSLVKDDKKSFMELVSRKNKQYNNKIQIVTEDPLKFLYGYENNSLNLKVNLTNSCVFGGCTAGISSININSDGVITPCSMMEEKILDINDYDNVCDIINSYENSPIIKKLFSRKYNGICGKCKLNRICGGCRAVAKAYTGDFMGSDLSCWRYRK